MATLNKVLMIGNLTRDPELRYTQGGAAVCKFGLAVSRQFTGKDGEKKEEVCFVDIDVWQKLAEICAEYLKKGSPVFVEGRLRLDRWEDKDGGKRSKLSITAENIQFLSRGQKGGAGEAPEAGAEEPEAPRQKSRGRAEAPPAGDAFPPEEEPPF